MSDVSGTRCQTRWENVTSPRDPVSRNPRRMMSTAEDRCVIFPPATLPLVSRTKVSVSGIDSSAIVVDRLEDAVVAQLEVRRLQPGDDRGCLR